LFSDPLTDRDGRFSVKETGSSAAGSAGMELPEVRGLPAPGVTEADGLLALGLPEAAGRAGI
jgi:hypothetical protein